MAENNRLIKVPSGSRRGWFVPEKGGLWGAVKREMGGYHIIKEMNVQFKTLNQTLSQGVRANYSRKTIKYYKAKKISKFCRFWANTTYFWVIEIACNLRLSLKDILGISKSAKIPSPSNNFSKDFLSSYFTSNLIYWRPFHKNVFFKWTYAFKVQPRILAT